MIWLDGKEFASQMMNGGTIETMWLNGHIIWQGIRSCYGKGYWRPEKPWLDNEKWKDN